MSRAIVVGAGIAGLAAAWDLTRAGVDVIVLESERRPGGIIITEQREAFLVEGGPDGFLGSEPDLPALAAELGIADRVVGQQARGSSLWNGQTLEPLEEGRAATLLGIDTHGGSVTAGFRTFAGGMLEPVVALAGQLAGHLRYTQGVTGIAPTSAGWRVALTGGSAHEAEAVVLAVPAYTAGRWLESIGVAGARALADVVYGPSVTVSLAYRSEQIGGRLEGTGFVASSGALRACTFASAKYAGRAPDGYALLRAFLTQADGDPAALAHAELSGILGIRGAPLWSRAFHWTRGLPRYREHHGANLTSVRDRLGRLAPLALAGAGYDGAGVSACVRSGREAGRSLLARWSAGS